MSGHIWQDPRFSSRLERKTYAVQDLNVAAGTSGEPYPGKRTAHYAPSTCACDLPEVGRAMDVATEALPIGFGCSVCGGILNADTLGNAFRRWPGDLDSAEMQVRRRVLEAEREMRGLIASLPRAQQEHLEAFARRDPEGFDIEARKLIERYLGAKAYDAIAIEKNPNTRRRFTRMRHELADRVDELVASRGVENPRPDGEGKEDGGHVGVEGDRLAHEAPEPSARVDDAIEPTPAANGEPSLGDVDNR